MKCVVEIELHLEKVNIKNEFDNRVFQYFLNFRY